MINKGVAAYCESQNNNLIITTAFGCFLSDVSSLIKANQKNLQKKVLFCQVILKEFLKLVHFTIIVFSYYRVECVMAMALFL